MFLCFLTQINAEIVTNISSQKIGNNIYFLNSNNKNKRNEETQKHMCAIIKCACIEGYPGANLSENFTPHKHTPFSKELGTQLYVIMLPDFPIILL